jgi:5'-methylthioadenosine phosphorylase
MADPFCNELAQSLYRTLQQSGEVKVHQGGTYVCIEGPQFSTRAESHLYRVWGADIIGMTAIPEAKIFREAEMCYSMIALSTDYDCWHEEEVTVEMVLNNMKTNVQNVKKLLPEIIQQVPLEKCACESAAAFAAITDPALIPHETRKKLDIFYGPYWQK